MMEMEYDSVKKIYSLLFVSCNMYTVCIFLFKIVVLNNLHMHDCVTHFLK